MLTFEGQQFQGVQAIMKKITVSFILVISCLVLFQIALKEGVFLVCFSFVVHKVKDKRLWTKVKQENEGVQGERKKAVEQL